MERNATYDITGPPNGTLTVLLPPESNPTSMIGIALTGIPPPPPTANSIAAPPLQPQQAPPLGPVAVAINNLAHMEQQAYRPQLSPHMCDRHRMVDEIPPPKADFSAPPPYDLATKLPSYEEVQREKTLQGELPLPTRCPSSHHRQQTLAFLAIDTESADPEGENGLLGTDVMFVMAFFVAFIFNWIGFLLLMCFCHTVAARYGALSGFGLSLAKWTLIVKHSTEFASHENSWLWWLIMAFGLLICVRAVIQYMNIKRGWRLLSGSAQERLLFFY